MEALRVGLQKNMRPYTKQNNYKTEPIILALFGTNLSLLTYRFFAQSSYE